ncbi:MAG TPA: sigma-70 family RNA polymerase sigma factor [Bacteroidota bacterium]|nr:sigma-70 family RNA polymerase sigma factor [Bacteroidota bacterium]
MTDDQTLVRRYLEGERGAFGPLVEKYQKTVYNVALRMINDPDDAADITQNVFIKASEKLGTYNPKFKFFSWIYRITVNESINFVESSRRNEGLDEEPAAGDRNPEEILQAGMLSNSVEEGLTKLSDDNRIVIILRHFEELSYDEIGFILDLPVRTVKSRLFTARQSLKKILSNRLEL